MQNISFNYETPSKILFSAGRKRIKSAHTPTSVYYCVNTTGVQKKNQSGRKKSEGSVRSEVVRGINQV